MARPDAPAAEAARAAMLARLPARFAPVLPRGL